jgi:hypothetical protein
MLIWKSGSLLLMVWSSDLSPSPLSNCAEATILEYSVGPRVF